MSCASPCVHNDSFVMRWCLSLSTHLSSGTWWPVALWWILTRREGGWWPAISSIGSCLSWRWLLMRSTCFLIMVVVGWLVGDNCQQLVKLLPMMVLVLCWWELFICSAACSESPWLRDMPRALSWEPTPTHRFQINLNHPCIVLFWSWFFSCHALFVQDPGNEYLLITAHTGFQFNENPSSSKK